MSSREKPDPVQEQLVALSERLAGTDARVSALSMRGGLERRDDYEVVELRAANESLRRAMFGSRRAPLRPAFPSPVLLHAIPGLAAQFHGRVPTSNVVRPARGEGVVDVRCRCGELVVVREAVERCECGRWFTVVDGVVGVARPAPEEPEAE